MQTNLKGYIANAGSTIKEFSELIGCHHQYLSRIATGNVLPSKRLARDIMAATGFTVNIKSKEKKPKPKLTDFIHVEE